jgi:thiol-disulfide isomerase/thioredoxin
VFAHVHMPSLGGATEWLDSAPLGPAELRGHVVLVDFWTLTCINWLRTEPYIRAWSQAYRNDRLSSLASTRPSSRLSTRSAASSRRPGARDRLPGRGRQRLRNLERLRHHDWPALYFVDTDSIIRDHHVGEGRYEQSEPATQRLLGVERELVCVEGLGVLIGVLSFPP